MAQSDDWRLTNQPDDVQGVTLYYRHYTAPSPTWDHDHCAFCWRTFMERDDVPDVLLEGYTTDDARHWICGVCVADFKERFQWTFAE